MRSNVVTNSIKSLNTIEVMYLLSISVIFEYEFINNGVKLLANESLNITSSLSVVALLFVISINELAPSKYTSYESRLPRFPSL